MLLGQTHPINMLGSSPSGKHAENSRPAAHVEDDLATEEVLVVVDGVAVGERTDLILQHLFMDSCSHGDRSVSDG